MVQPATLGEEKDNNFGSCLKRGKNQKREQIKPLPIQNLQASQIHLHPPRYLHI
jgi:hypothetical protein